MGRIESSSQGPDPLQPYTTQPGAVAVPGPILVTDAKIISDHDGVTYFGDSDQEASDNEHEANSQTRRGCITNRRVGVLIIVLALIGLAVGIPLLLQKNDVFTRKNTNITEDGLCIAPRCLADADCIRISDNSTIFRSQCYHATLRCSNEENLVPDHCPCIFDSDCVSGRCEGFAAGFSKCRESLPDGSYCNEATDCSSGRCDRPGPLKAPVCMPRKTEACASCNEHTDCASGTCSWGRCTDTNGTLGADCTCLSSSECSSGRCEFVSNNPLEGKVCKGKAPSCGGCSEDSDCQSGSCFKSVFRCRNENGKMDDECNCLKNADCESERCDGVSLNPLDGYFCWPKEEECAPCNEDSDCTGGKCNLLFQKCGNDRDRLYRCWLDNDGESIVAPDEEGSVRE